MAENTEIAWCDSTFNPWIGCSKVSPGCDHCYAERDFDLRKHRVKWGPGQARSRTAPANWKKPQDWNAERFFQCTRCGWRGTVPGARHDPHRLAFYSHVGCNGDLIDARRRVFCASLADVFDNEVPQEWREDLFALIEKTPHLDWLLLTKRIGNARTMMPPDWIVDGVPRNVWLGATFVNQEEYDRDIGKLLRTPARVHFLSIEPMLSAIDMRMGGASVPDYAEHRPLAPLSWVIVGGESGPKARPMHPDWARSLRDQCAAAGVPFLFKQHGEWAGAGGQPNRLPHVWMTLDGKAAPYTAGETYHPPWNRPWQHEDPETLAFMAKVGKKAAGRLLDGVTHDGFPA